MREKRGRKAIALALALAMAVPMSLSGCRPQGTGDEKATPGAKSVVGSQEVAADLRDKYKDQASADYVPGELSVERDHQFTISYDFDPFELGMETYPEIAALYYDSELTDIVPANYDWADEEKKSYTISPWEYPTWTVYSPGAEDYPFGYDEDAYRLFDRGAYADWGNAGTLYLATWVDTATGEPLERPSVQVINIRGEVAAPTLSVELNDEGVVQFSWNEVNGAEAYYIIVFDSYEDRISRDGRCIGYTTGTMWSNTTSDYMIANQSFVSYTISEDDWLSPSMVEHFEGQHDPQDGAVQSLFFKSYCVIAVNKDGMSMFSNIVDNSDIAARSPHVIAYNMEKLSEEGFSTRVEGVNRMPAYRWIVMCNGELSQRLVNYDFDAASEEVERWFYYDDDDPSFEPYFENVDVLKVSYKVDGTPFAGTLIISEYDKDNWRTQLDAIESRQESLRGKTGDINRDIVAEEEPGEEPGLPTETEIAVVDVPITASSALSEYLAINMIAGVEAIDLSAFPEAYDIDLLIDAWSEAVYQNPLVLGVAGARASYDRQTLFVIYDDDQATREAKQSDLSAEVDRVIAEIIDDSMSARDKEYAINRYLCDTVEYDYAALDNAAQYGYMMVDAAFYDSFTAYGALINGVGVCASYAASFKLLADAAGLNCVVVTGYYEGSFAHAWNRVEIEAGVWATVDATNNDSDIMPNALLNMPDYAVSRVLVEDDVWMMDFALAQYRSEDASNEYYRVMGMYFERDTIVDEIVQQLSTSDVAIVRTDYLLTEDQFYDIGWEVVLATGNTEIVGTYWMGLIILTSDISIFE